MTSTFTSQDTPTLRVVITKQATTFSGAANLHRLDAPSPAEVARNVRSIFGPDPGGAHVHLVAQESVIHAVDQALADYDVHLTGELATDEWERSDAHEPEQASAASEPRHRLREEPDGIGPAEAYPARPSPVRRPQPEQGLAGELAPDTDRRGAWVLAGVVGVVVLACAVAVWLTVRGLFGEAGADGTGGGGVDKHEAPAPEVIEQDGLSVELPAGFTLEQDGDMWRAVGPDPNFRLQLSVDDRFNLPPETLAEQLRKDIALDDDVELVTTDGHAVTYLERAADGSQALWKTWPEGNVQLSVGCHTREAPTQIQEATCAMAMNSARFDGGNVQVEVDKGVVALEG